MCLYLLSGCLRFGGFGLSCLCCRSIYLGNWLFVYCGFDFVLFVDLVDSVRFGVSVFWFWVLLVFV